MRLSKFSSKFNWFPCNNQWDLSEFVIGIPILKRILTQIENGEELFVYELGHIHLSRKSYKVTYFVDYCVSERNCSEKVYFECEVRCILCWNHSKIWIRKEGHKFSTIVNNYITSEKITSDISCQKDIPCKVFIVWHYFTAGFRTKQNRYSKNHQLSNCANMFRNSIKEFGEPSLEAASLPRRDSLSRLHDAIRSAAVDGRVSSRVYVHLQFNWFFPVSHSIRFFCWIFCFCQISLCFLCKSKLMKFLFIFCRQFADQRLFQMMKKQFWNASELIIRHKSRMTWQCRVAHHVECVFMRMESMICSIKGMQGNSCR